MYMKETRLNDNYTQAHTQIKNDHIDVKTHFNPLNEKN